MNRRLVEQTARPIAVGLVLLLVLIGILGTAIRDPRPHDIPVGLVAPVPVAQQLSGGLDKAAPGAFALTRFTDEAEARRAIDRRDVVAALVVTDAGPKLLIAGAAGEAVTGAVTAAFTGAFQSQGTKLAIELVHPFPVGDPHGIVLFFLVLATLVASGRCRCPDRAWRARSVLAGSDRHAGRLRHRRRHLGCRGRGLDHERPG